MQAMEPRLLINAYCNGIFPMGLENGRLTWFSPDPRGVIPVSGYRVPRSVRAELRRNGLEVRVNTRFGDVLRRCGDRVETWITQEIINSYEKLHELGMAHSVEAWWNGRLVGGLYGVCVGGAFFGESMFSLVPGGSKTALVWLLEHLERKGFLLHDTQWTTPHLAMFGGMEIAREEYLRLLSKAVEMKVSFLG